MRNKKTINNKGYKLEKGFTILLSIWCACNTIYWEISMDYQACSICLWHRYLYIILSVLTVLLIVSRKSIIRRMVLLVVSLELLISLEYIYSFLCFDSICRIISMADKVVDISDRLNFLVTFTVLVVLSILESIIVIKHKRLK